MSQSGFTPIQLYYSTTASTAPSAGNLANGELAINITDGKLFYKDNGGVVQVLATKGAGTIGGATTQVQYNNAGTLAGSSNLTFDGTTLTLGANPVLNGGTANGLAYLNGSKVLTTGSALTFDGTNLSLLPSGYSVFGASSSEQMRLTSTGLGIGTSSPGSYGKLAVVGQGVTAAITSFGTGGSPYETPIAIAAYTGPATPAGLYSQNTFVVNSANWLTFKVSNSAGTTSTAATLDSSGNLGLGVTPTAGGATTNFEIGPYGATIAARNNSSAPQLYISSNAVGQAYSPTYKVNGYATQYVMQGFDGAHRWLIAPSGTAGNAISFTQAMTLDANGNLLLGATATINAAKALVAFSSSNNGLYVQDSTGVSAAQFMRFDSTTNTCGSITRVGATSAVTYNATSDYRLKTVIGPVVDAGQRIDALEPIEYEWKADGTHTRGFLAHKFQEVYSHSVSGEKDAVDAEGKPIYQAMQASSPEVIADLVAEIQSLRKRLAAAGI
jgi:Chaperone of endosialidase